MTPVVSAPKQTQWVWARSLQASFIWSQAWAWNWDAFLNTGVKVPYRTSCRICADSKQKIGSRKQNDNNKKAIDQLCYNRRNQPLHENKLTILTRVLFVKIVLRSSLAFSWPISASQCIIQTMITATSIESKFRLPWSASSSNLLPPCREWKNSPQLQKKLPRSAKFNEANFFTDIESFW